MPIALILITLAGTGSPLRPDSYVSHLSAPQGLLLPELAGSRRTEIAQGSSQILSGAILSGAGLVLGGGGGAILAIFGQYSGSGLNAGTAMGWTFIGLGALLAVVGIPLIIYGIVTVSKKPGRFTLGLEQDGSLAVHF